MTRLLFQSFPSMLRRDWNLIFVAIVSHSETYSREELDAQLLYVGMTRPLHQLYVCAKRAEDVLLDDINKDLFMRETGELGSE
ncbi:hypothetical protein GCM10020331_086320 [Ectobacillus funiculus]